MKKSLSYIELFIPFAALGTSLYMIFFYAPVESQMGIVQKIFYFHVPAAYSMYLSWVVCTASSVVYIIKKDDIFDIVASSSAKLALLFAIMVMITGPLWGRKSWGAYWVWDPRLTSALLLTLVILSYVLLRSSNRDTIIKKFSAAIAIIGAAIIPIVHISVYKWRGQHPAILKTGGLEPEMLQTFLFSMAAFTVVSAVLLHRTIILEKQHRLLNNLKQAILANSLSHSGKSTDE